MTFTPITDTEAIQRIWEEMDGTEWNSTTLDVIAAIVLATGRPPFRDVDWLNE